MRVAMLVIAVCLLSAAIAHASENATVMRKETERIYYDGREIVVKRVFVENTSGIKRLEALKEELLMNLTELENELATLSGIESNLTETKKALESKLQSLKNETRYLLRRKAELESNLSALKEEMEKFRATLSGAALVSKDTLTAVYVALSVLIALILLGEVIGLRKRRVEQNNAV